MSFWRSIGGLFRRRKVSVYVALSDQDLYRVTGKLRDAGIPYHTKTPGIMGLGELNTNNFIPGDGNRFTEYEIYVKREDAERAVYVIGSGGF